LPPVVRWGTKQLSIVLPPVVRWGTKQLLIVLPPVVRWGTKQLLIVLPLMFIVNNYNYTLYFVVVGSY